MIISGKVFNASDLSNHGEVFRKLNPPARLSVFGDPIAHSASPPMQNAALRENGHAFQYVRILVGSRDLSQALADLPDAGFIGTNLTVPHKQAALVLVAKVSKEAQLMGAIITVAVQEGKLRGYNTDGPGFAAAIHDEFGTSLGDMRVMILGGAGGAGRAITVQCALAGCPGIVVANRTSGKADILATEIRTALGANVSAIPMLPENLRKTIPSVDLVVNATTLGMKATDPSPLPDKLLQGGQYVYDTVYGINSSALLRQADSAGAKKANGFSMLLHQGALAYEIWFGKPAPLETMRIGLKSSLEH